MAQTLAGFKLKNGACVLLLPNDANNSSAVSVTTPSSSYVASGVSEPAVTPLDETMASAEAAVAVSLTTPRAATSVTRTSPFAAIATAAEIISPPSSSSTLFAEQPTETTDEEEQNKQEPVEPQQQQPVAEPSPPPPPPPPRTNQNQQQQQTLVNTPQPTPPPTPMKPIELTTPEKQTPQQQSMQPPTIIATPDPQPPSSFMSVPPQYSPAAITHQITQQTQPNTSAAEMAAMVMKDASFQAVLQQMTLATAAMERMAAVFDRIKDLEAIVERLSKQQQQQQSFQQQPLQQQQPQQMQQLQRAMSPSRPSSSSCSLSPATPMRAQSVSSHQLIQQPQHQPQQTQQRPQSSSSTSLVTALSTPNYARPTSSRQFNRTMPSSTTRATTDTNMVLFIASDGAQFQLPPHLAYQCLACHPPKRCFEFPHMSSQILNLVSVFLRDVDSESLPSLSFHVGIKPLLRVASVLQLAPLMVYSIAISMSSSSSSSTDQQQQTAEIVRFVAKCKWLMDRQVPEWIRLEGDCQQWKLVNPVFALDLLWFAKFCIDFNLSFDTLEYHPQQQQQQSSSDQIGWKRAYAETRIQNSLLSSGVTKIAAEEFELWERTIGSLVQNLDLSSSELVTDDSMELVLRMCPNLHVLDLHGSLHITNKTIGKLTKAKPPLSWLNLSETATTKDGIDILLEHYPSLQILF